MATVAAHVAHALIPHTGAVFGLMGNGNIYFVDAIEKDGRLPFVSTRHEAGTVIAADAYHRAGGGVAIATTTYGPGYTNTMTALAEAVKAHTPLLLVAGDAPTTGIRPWDVDEAALARAVGAEVFAVTLDDPVETATAALEHALKRRTPVFVSIPYDISGQDAGPLPELRPLRRVAPVAADATATAEAAAILRSARRPIVLGGRGAHLSGAGPALDRIAALLGAPTASTALARGLFSDARYDLGVTGGFGQEEAMQLFQEADVVLVAGAGLNQFTMRFHQLFGPDTRVVQIDDQATTGTHPRVTTFLRGDARLTAEALVEALAGTAGSGWREALPGFGTGAYRFRDAGEEFAEDGRLDPRAVAARLAGILPDDRVVVSDVGHFMGWANTHWEVAAPNRMMMIGTAYQCIGLGTPSALGAHLALPDATVVFTTGDGGALMSMADLTTVVNNVRRAVVVVWNDAAYGTELALYAWRGIADRPMRIQQADFAALGLAAGAVGATVVERLDDLDELRAWLAKEADGVYVVDCRISPDVIAPYQQEMTDATSPKH